jgi:Uma2 family endonuclease
MIATIAGPPKRRKPKQNIPDYLIYEIMDGKPIHYAGYLEVLSGKKTFSEIMGSSYKQSLIISYLLKKLFSYLDDDKYTILSNEIGLHLDNRNNLSGDLYIFESQKLDGLDIHDNYLQIAPKVAIEVDIIADELETSTDNYIYIKTQKLLQFGVEKVIWITTKAKKVTIATQNADWQVRDWNKPFEVIDGFEFNIGKFLEEKGTKIP